MNSISELPLETLEVAQLVMKFPEFYGVLILMLTLHGQNTTESGTAVA